MPENAKLVIAVVFGICAGVLGTLLATAPEGLESPAPVGRTPTPEPTPDVTTTPSAPEYRITIEQMKGCLDGYGARAQPESALPDELGLAPLVQLAEAGNGSLRAFGNDAVLFFMADTNTATQAATDNPDVVVQQEANVVAAARDPAKLAARQRQALEACLTAG